MADVDTKKKNCPVLMAVVLVKKTRCKNIENTSKLSDNEESYKFLVITRPSLLQASIF